MPPQWLVSVVDATGERPMGVVFERDPSPTGVDHGPTVRARSLPLRLTFGDKGESANA
jgi:hypothetical protein